MSRRWAGPLYESIVSLCIVRNVGYTPISRSHEDDLSWKSKKIKALRTFELRSISRAQLVTAVSGESLENFALWSALVFENGVSFTALRFH